MSKKIRVEGNGAQAPYGIGEIMKIIPAGHIQKIRKELMRFYNPPTLRCDYCGAVVTMEVEENPTLATSKNNFYLAFSCECK